MNPAAVTHPHGSPLVEPIAGDEEISFAVLVAIGLLVVWTVSQVITMIPALPLEARKILLPAKVLIGPAAIAAVTVIGRPSLRIPTALLGILFFTVFSTMNLVLRAEPYWPHAALFVAWGACFVVIPGLLNTRERIHLFVRWTMWGLMAAVSLAMALAISEDTYVNTGGGRLRYHFAMNPNYFGGLTAVLAITGLAALVLDPGRNRWGGRLALTAGIVLTILSDSRAQGMMLVFVLLVYGTHTRGGWRRACQVVLVGGIGAAVGALLLLGTPMLTVERADAISSGRLTIWQQLLEENLGTGGLPVVLWGAGRPQFDVRSLDRAHYREDDPMTRSSRASARFTRVAFDNAYLDILVSTGLLGLLFGLYAWFRWWRWLSGLSPLSDDARVRSGLAKALIAGTLAASFFWSCWPSMGSLLHTFGGVLAIGLTASLDREITPLSALPDTVRHDWNPPGRLR